MNPHSTPYNPTPSKQRALRGNFLTFTGVLAAVFLLLYLFPLVLLRLPGFEGWNISSDAVDIDYTFTTPHIDADIVIIGESSALYGIDPHQMSSSLNLKTTNLANTLQTLPIIVRMQLDRYLSQNKRPKLLVFYLTPWDLNFFESTLDRFDGDEMLLRYGSARQILHYATARPFELLVFPFKFYAVNSIFSPARRDWPPPNRAIVQQNGHANLDVRSPLDPTCAFPPSLLQKADRTTTIDALLRRYGNAADKVILYVAPIPQCAGYQALLNGPWQRLKTAPPQVLPAPDFGDDTYYAHPLPTSVPAVTQLLAHRLQQELASAHSH